MESGRFPDGTVFVKELFATHTEKMTTGLVSRATDIEGRYPGNALWGDGWGWAQLKDTIRTIDSKSYGPAYESRKLYKNEWRVYSVVYV